MQKTRPSRPYMLFFGLLYLKFLFFDLLWDFETTFSSFSFLQSYVNKLAVVLIAGLPFMFWKKTGVAVVTWLLTDLFLLANLMYFRTYYTAIPLESYGLLDNLKDFTESVYDSLIWADCFFPLSTVAGWILLRRTNRKDRPAVSSRQALFAYFRLSALTFIGCGILFQLHGGILKQNEEMQNANYFTVRTPVFTLFGMLYCDYKQQKNIYHPEIGKEINTWLTLAEQDFPPAPETTYDHCIVILAESLESWVLEKSVEGKEITPYLNALLKEPGTVYAPHVLTQVKGGRSIDAQLMLYTGLLPIRNGAYSIKHPNNRYPTLVKAFKQRYPDAKAYAMTVDKNITWNQQMVALSFGFDSLIWKKDFRLDEKVGTRKRLGDYSFLRQCADKMESDALWPAEGHTFLQCVTYSGHNPFKIPEKLKQIRFSGQIPALMNDYMTAANYTDRAIGHFLERLRRHPQYARTLIVITGDHEGLASSRKGLVQTPAGRDIVSPERFTPFIVVNAPWNLRYEKVMGQMDMYPTLLHLLGLNRYEWKGLGTSILSPARHPGFAIGPQMETVGDTAQADPRLIRFREEAWDISDKIIQYDYWSRTGTMVQN